MGTAKTDKPGHLCDLFRTFLVCSQKHFVQNRQGQVNLRDIFAGFYLYEVHVIYNV